MLVVIKILLVSIAIFLALLLIGFLVIPVRIRIDTDEGYALLSWGSLLNAKVIWLPIIADASINYRILFYSNEKPLFELLQNKKEKEKKESKRKNKASVSRLRNGLKMGKAIMKSFKVNYFRLSVDTGDYCLNGMLYPIFYAGRFRGLDTEINFTGRNYLIADVQNTGSRILYSIIKTKLSSNG